MNDLSVDKILSDLRASDQDILISLPYRVGLFVSFSDITGGWEAQEKEITSLTSILRQFSEDYCKNELAQKLLMDCLSMRAQWPLWSQKIDAVPAEAGRAVEILTRLLPEKTVTELKEVLVDIALAVATTFRENHVEPFDAGPDHPILSGMLSRIARLGAQKDPLSNINISAAEKAALVRLCKALGYDLGRAA